MFQIIIVPKDTGATACMYYNTSETAEIAQKNIHEMQRKEDGILTVKDDYGFVLSMDIKNLCYALLIDVAQSHLLHGNTPTKPKFYDDQPH